MNAARSTMLLLLVLPSVGCLWDGLDAEGTVSGAGGVPGLEAGDLDVSVYTPQEGCEDLFGAQTNVAVSCDLDRELVDAWYMAMLPGGSCESVIELRDVEDLYRTCLPAIREMTCEEFKDEGFSDPTCQRQIVYDDDHTTPSEVCQDLANAYGVSIAFCGGDRQEAEDYFHGEVDCSRVVEIRNRAQFYEDCIPAVLQADCQDPGAPFGSDACSGQLLLRP